VDVALADPDTSQAELRAMAERVRDATQRSERLLEGLLTLARSEREPSRREPADLADAATQALQHGRYADTAGLQVLTRLEPAPVAGDPALLDRMVANLIENTMRHNRPNGWSPPAPIAVGGRAGHQRRPRHPPTGWPSPSSTAAPTTAAGSWSRPNSLPETGRRAALAVGASFSHHAQGRGSWPDGFWHARSPAASGSAQPTRLLSRAHSAT
jgi:hypothetical protein